MTIDQAIDFWRVRVKTEGFTQEEFLSWCDQNEELARGMGDRLIADLPPLFEPLFKRIKDLFK